MSQADYIVIAVYLGGMLALGAWLARRQRSDEEYFLAGRRMPWFAVGVSVIASLLSSLTYLSEPGEVWNSGLTHLVGKMLGLPIEMALVWLVCVPFMMRFRYTSAYEYLEHRFSLGARRLGAALFVLMVVLWMGFVVLASARALAVVSGMSLFTVIATVGIVATIYTTLGGLRAVIWTDCIQVGLLVFGGLFAVFYVASQTGTWLPDWYAAATERLTAGGVKPMPWFSFDPTVRATIVTVALSMTVWHVCTHTANQMTVQRYFSTRDARAARRSFLTGSLLGVFLNLMLVAVGLALIYYYGQAPLPEGLDPSIRKERDLIFPQFAIHRLPPGLGGAILAALLAAAMSSIDSGINSIATVVTEERRRGETDKTRSHVHGAMGLTLVAGTFITFAAYLLNFLPAEYGIIDAMPRTFNAVTAPLGGLFLVGMFLPWVGPRAIVAAVVCGLATSVGIGYWEYYAPWLAELGWIDPAYREVSLSFTWVMPCALTVVFCVAALLGLWDRSRRLAPGLTIYSRPESPFRA